jgi:gamma-glutamyl hydrolase
LNGFLIPGGAANLRPGHDFFDTAARVLDFALRSNDAGNVFPVLGICLGFETLMVLTAGAWLGTGATGQPKTVFNKGCC